MGKMKNFGTSETMQTLMRKSVCALMRKSVCALLSLLLLLSAVLPVKAAAETAPAKVVRVGSFEDTFNYVNEKGARKGYGYELLETLSGYTGWQFEYVTCDWSDCFEKLENEPTRTTFAGAVSAAAFTGSTADSSNSRLSTTQALFRVKVCMVSLIPEFFILSNLSPPQTASFRFHFHCTGFKKFIAALIASGRQQLF